MNLNYNFNYGSSSMFNSYIKNKTLSSNQHGYKIPILFAPDSASESVNASFDQQNIPGRSAPIISYSYTGARQVSISFYVTPDHLPEGYSSIQDYTNAIKALEYPSYSNGIVTSPNCELVLPSISLDGVCTSVAIDYKTDRYTRNKGMSATISLTFLEVMDSIKGSINIISGGVVDTTSAVESYENIDISYEDYSSSKEFTLTGAGTSQNNAIKLEYVINGNGIWHNTFNKYKEDLDFGYTTDDNIKSIRVYIWLGLDHSWGLANIDNILGTGGVYSTIIGDSLDLYSFLVNKGIKKTTLEVIYYAENASGETIKSLSRYVDVIFR